MLLYMVLSGIRLGVHLACKCFSTLLRLCAPTPQASFNWLVTLCARRVRGLCCSVMLGLGAVLSYVGQGFVPQQAAVANSSGLIR